MKILVFMSDNRALEVNTSTAGYCSLAAVINATYCQRHGYDFKYYKPFIGIDDERNARLFNCMDPNSHELRHASWAKILAALHILDVYDHNYDYIVYIDSDCIFKTHETTIESIIKQYPEHSTNLIFFNDNPWSPEDPCGGFFIAATNNLHIQRTKRILEKWYQHKSPKHNREHPWEQAALVHLYTNQSNKTKDADVLGIRVHDAVMFNEEAGQFLRHICHDESHSRTPYFRNFILTILRNIDYTTTIRKIDSEAIDTNLIVSKSFKIPYTQLSSSNSSPKLKVLVTILTSSSLDLFEVCFQSVIRQKYIKETCPEVSFHPVVLVNTRNPGYFKEVKDLLFNVYNFTNVFETESNGLPGKGHNSEIEYFRQHMEYDWMFPVDGDDLIYPTAFLQLGRMLQDREKALGNTNPKPFDVMFHLGLDRVNWEAVTGSVAVTKGIFLRTSYAETDLFAENRESIKNPFLDEHPLHTLSCPVRVCLLNRAAASLHSPEIRWDESAVMLEDYPPFLAALHHSLITKEIVIAGTSNRYLYMYNQLNENRVTTNFTKNKKTEADNRVFKDAISRSVFQGVRENWALALETCMNFVGTNDDPEFDKNIPSKLAFLKDTIVPYYMKQHLKRLERLYQSAKWSEFVKEVQLLYDRYYDHVICQPILLCRLRLNTGVAFYHQGSYECARSEWLEARKLNVPVTTLNESIDQNLSILEQHQQKT